MSHGEETAVQQAPATLSQPRTKIWGLERSLPWRRASDAELLT